MEKVNERLRKTVAILEEAKVPYAIVGGHAVRAWVAQVDEGAVRTTRDVEVLVRPAPQPLSTTIENDPRRSTRMIVCPRKVEERDREMLNQRCRQK